MSIQNGIHLQRCSINTTGLYNKKLMLLFQIKAKYAINLIAVVIF